jgi:hypothetical protein
LEVKIKFHPFKRTWEVEKKKQKKITCSIGKCSWKGEKNQNEREVIEPKTIVLSKGCWKKKN